ncbi:MAG: septum formation initiator family protein [Geodermatophilaceae bacterium]|nr:septum formation initiator family protein [Geodermatophilaceae bacterium]
MSTPRGPGSRRGGRRNGLTGASRPEGRRSSVGLTRSQGRGRGPGDKRSTRGPGPTRATGAPQAAQHWTARLTGRAVLLAAAVVLLVLSLAYPLQRYLAQQASISRLESDNRAAQQRVEDLRTQVDQLDDPAFIRTQAESRLQYVMPGDLLYVIDDSGTAQQLPGQGEPADADADQAWFEQVLASIERADADG